MGGLLGVVLLFFWDFYKFTQTSSRKKLKIRQNSTKLEQNTQLRNKMSNQLQFTLNQICKSFKIRERKVLVIELSIYSGIVLVAKKCFIGPSNIEAQNMIFEKFPRTIISRLGYIYFNPTT